MAIENKKPADKVAPKKGAAGAKDEEKMTGVDDIADKLTLSGWLRMEKPHEPFTMAVLQSLTAFGAGEDATISFSKKKTLLPIGQKLYIEGVRPDVAKMCNLGPVKAGAMELDDPGGKKKKKKKNKKKGLSKDQIIAKKTADDVKKYLPSLLDAAKNVPKSREDRAELRVVQFILYVNEVFSVVTRDPNSHLGYEALVAMHNAISSAVGVPGIAQQVIEDAREILERLRKAVNFDYEHLLTVYPRLVFSNLYSDLYHEAIIKPYADQIRVVESLSVPSSLSFYNTVPGSGKTTAVVGVVSRLTSITDVTLKDADKPKEDKPALNKGGRKWKTRKRNMARKKEKGMVGSRVVIFVCTNMLVREQVGRDAYNINIPFAVAANHTFREHFNARARDPTLIICDLETCMEMLEKYENPVLFIDEPTIAAESDHQINGKIMQLLAHAPKQTILSSATLPRPDELPGLCGAFKNRHPTGEINVITSTRIGIGCHAVFDGITVFPFEGCTTVDRMRVTLDTLKTNPFLFRFLSIEVVITLRQRMVENKLAVDSFETLMPNPSSITYQKIADHAIDLLTLLVAEGTDEQVTNCCQPLSVAKYRPFRLESLLTEDAHQHMQGALFATTTPLKKALELSALFLKDMPSIQDMMRVYNLKKEQYQASKARIEKSVKNEDKKTQQLQALVEPSLDVPAKYIPNTQAHVEKFAPNAKYDPRALQSPPIASNIPEDLNVPDEVLLLLYLGIGVYSPGSTILNPTKMDGIDTRYTDLVVQMCSAGYISFLFADRSIVYGTNFPFSNVFIDPEFAATSSLNTLYQLIGRAGRVGRSYMAKVILIGSKIRDRIVTFSEENIEATNLELSLGRVMDTLDGDNKIREKKKEEEKKEEVDYANNWALTDAQFAEAKKKADREKMAAADILAKEKAVQAALEKKKKQEDFDRKEAEEAKKFKGADDDGTLDESEEDEDVVDDWESLI